MMNKSLLIILNWNGLEDTINCVNSVLSRTTPKEKLDLAIVDNGSLNNDFEKLLEKFGNVKNIKVLETKKNLGYCGGNNYVVNPIINKEEYDYFIILNNDTVLVDDSLNKMISYMENNETIGAASPVVLSYFNPKRIDTIGLNFSLWTGVSIALGNGQKLKAFINKKIDRPYSISGACFIIRAKALKEINYLFDEDFFCYFEETELSIRLRKRGYEIATLPNARILHKGSVSSKRISGFSEYQLIRNRFLVEKKHASFFQKLTFLIITVCLYLTFRIIMLLKNSNQANLKFFLRGFIAGLILFFGGKLINFNKK